MHKVKNEQIPQIFKTIFSKTNNKYNTRSCRRLTFSKPLYKTKSTQYNISFRGPHLWNSLVPNGIKKLVISNFQIKNQNFVFWYYKRNTVLLKCTYQLPCTYIVTITEIFFYLNKNPQLYK